MFYTNSLAFYLIDKKDPVVEQYRVAIEDAVTGNSKGLTLTFNALEVANMLTGKFEDMLGALQHVSKSMPHLVRNVHFKFIRYSDPQDAGRPGSSEKVIPEQEWKASPLYHRFFHKMFTEVPYSIFFAHDSEVRLYMIAGDYTKGKSPDVSTVEIPQGRKVKSIGGATSRINKRLTEAGITMLLYAHGSGFNAKETILGILNEHLISPEYSKIFKQYERDVAKSFTLNTGPLKGGSGAV